ncbi:hypothetical protein A3K29_05570 [Candidatus Collierbacteria bacterium RIFOXYB2_FULL_46_14]|nr:MAG: hypothetical protein A3K29_05570 [Candidatus Collierbacteria bacterium RIFOXYB2_FULL_46_14]OGD76599.1 MAG: hypothetical protein A3K43_05570 [Candidatus Collierbacteria bacterium RIFOXYA2_FULL_46_20]OGD77935.1 MAG: hypothetical protein A3K39_05570 [Candidatus Collierbacteria bacterium RIFOXYC2_FULL_43_15]OGD82657.1 MAG: hypothetical protein A3K36_05570 [Candidatus Collierbacteria bacterium RIFOXYD2_FULL_45_13]
MSKFLKTILSVVMSLRKVRLMSPRQMVLSAKKWWKTPRQGSLSNKAVYNLALRNLRNQPSRTAMTVTAIAMGTAAVVFLVSFAYGLQDIVTKRLVSPNSMRLTDVVSSTTSLALTDKTIDDIKKIDGVDDVAQMISLAGSLTLSDSRLDVVVLSVGQNYFNYASPSLVSGAWMSPEAFTKYTGATGELSSLVGEVAGYSTDTQNSEDPVKGDLIEEDEQSFLIDDDEYLPVRERPERTSRLLGYIRGSVLKSYKGKLVWGGDYNSVDSSGKTYLSQEGEWFGKWMRAKIPLYKELVSTIYEPMIDEAGQQVTRQGFLTLNSVKILNKTQEYVQEGMEKIGGQVLGEATEAGVTQISVAGMNSTVSAELVKVAVQETTDHATASAELSLVEIKRVEGKEVVVTSALLNTFKLKPEEVIGKTVTLQYILSGGQIPGSSGRVLTNVVQYKVTGVVKDDKKPMVYVPVQDLQSVGVDKYSQLKVLAKDSTSLPGVREKIQAMGFSTQSIMDTLAQVDRLFRVMRFLLGAFGFTALVVALFGMFNTLTISLLERSREVGVMKTLGTVDRDIFRLFMAESVLIGIIGGTSGVVVGNLVGKTVNLLSMLWREDKTINLFKTPTLFALGVLLLAIGVGFATGLYPAMRAKKISALNALRYE